MDAPGTIPQPITSSPDSPPMTWQNAFWAPITLNVNAMTSPSRRIIAGFPSINPIYYLSAPTLCIVDAIMVPIRLFIYLIKLPVSFSSCLRLVLWHLFGQPDENREPGADNFRDGIYTTFVRVLFSVSASSMPFLEKAEINWMLCAKILGVMFLVSFAVVEILAICSWKMDLNHNPRLADDTNQALQDAEKIAKHVEDVLVTLANALHAGLILCAVVVLWPEQRPKPPSRRPGLHLCLKFGRLLFELACYGDWVVIFVAAPYLWYYEMLGCLLLDAMVFLGIWLCSQLLSVGISKLSQSYPLVGERLLHNISKEGEVERKNDGRFVIGEEKILPISLFVWNLALCVLWYVFRYNV